MTLTQNSKIKALLGPTNTGKTFFAMQKMLSFGSGIIGFPLRLLARENYEKAVSKKGVDNVALITGEEKIIPPKASYYICTTESMPIDKKVDFIAVDEIQLSADRERGHIFTERILSSRGQSETMLLGSENMRPLITKIIPDIKISNLKRLSSLKYSGIKKLTNLPPRTAIVTFSREEVYEIADVLRRAQGGAALVLGALSPRTRNSQVDLYHSGEVDYIVATDAIGMGLNMDVDHLAFASLTKFDGRRRRKLSSLELAQIAGRAGRNKKNGTFGTLTGVEEIPEEVIRSIESHEFKNVDRVYWRNNELNFTSINNLIRSLKKPSPKLEFMKSPPADDQVILEILQKNFEITKGLRSEEDIRLLWDIAQVPDFRKLLPEVHAAFLVNVFKQLTGEKKILSEDWIKIHVSKLEKINGDIHLLMDKIAAIRIWTYLANRTGWVESEKYWQEKTKQIEDKLSDILNEKLTQKFIDRRTASFSKKLKKNEIINTRINDESKLIVDGHSIGSIIGLSFTPDNTYQKSNKIIRSVSNNVLSYELESRINKIISSGYEFLGLDDCGNILWNKEKIARLSSGPSILEPVIIILCDELCNKKIKKKIYDYISRWINVLIKNILSPLIGLQNFDCSGLVRGIVFQLLENAGSFSNEETLSQLPCLNKNDRKTLASMKIRLGTKFIYMPQLLKSDQIKMRAILWKVFNSSPVKTKLPPSGRVSFSIEEGVSNKFYYACGYWVVNDFAYRVDMVERFLKELRNILRSKEYKLLNEKLSLLGVGMEQGIYILKGLGVNIRINDGLISIDPKIRRSKKIKINPEIITPNSDKAFYKLKGLLNL